MNLTIRQIAEAAGGRLVYNGPDNAQDAFLATKADNLHKKIIITRKCKKPLEALAQLVAAHSHCLEHYLPKAEDFT